MNRRNNRLNSRLQNSITFIKSENPKTKKESIKIIDAPKPIKEKKKSRIQILKEINNSINGKQEKTKKQSGGRIKLI